MTVIVEDLLINVYTEEWGQPFTIKYITNIHQYKYLLNLDVYLKH